MEHPPNPMERSKCLAGASDWVSSVLRRAAQDSPVAQPRKAYLSTRGIREE